MLAKIAQVYHQKSFYHYKTFSYQPPYNHKVTFTTSKSHHLPSCAQKLSTFKKGKTTQHRVRIPGSRENRKRVSGSVISVEGDRGGGTGAL
ncbi:hypothetical protein EB796_005688 [Bugula neritina]|uniref:Uncharacterized protein n=1 Tax=Bugula neritina TaxID=10212 RepID=A0A7J7KBI0_BUGNE|nr:hypothetical protein EB796_005688 [Bugula neritina]